MNHYEELGLTSSATGEEVRHAYKNLARLLHPDQQQDEALRQLAECQMRRLNAVCATLTDPERRAEYDRTLAPRNGAATVRERSSRVRTFWIWPAAAALGTAGLLSYFRTQPGPAPARILRTTEAAAPPPAKIVVCPRREVEKPGAGRRRPARPAPANAAAVLPEPPALASEPAPMFPFSLPQQPPPPAERVRPQARSLAGTWFYIPPRVAPLSQPLYPPEFIEAVIVAEAGLLRGRYHARYKVLDRPISPEVLFQFEGRAERDRGQFAWTGGGGAHGEVHLRLVSDNALEVSWSARELGTSLGLASGTAVLTRRQEP